MIKRGHFSLGSEGHNLIILGTRYACIELCNCFRLELNGSVREFPGAKC